MNYFSNNLNLLRKNRGLKQIELADILNVRASNINNWEKGSNYPKMDKLVEISSFFEVLMDELIKTDLSKVLNKDSNVKSKQNVKSINESTKSGTKSANKSISETVMPSYRSLTDKELSNMSVKEVKEAYPNPEGKQNIDELNNKMDGLIALITQIKGGLSAERENLYKETLAAQKDLIENLKSQLKEFTKSRSKPT